MEPELLQPSGGTFVAINEGTKAFNPLEWARLKIRTHSFDEQLHSRELKWKYKSFSVSGLERRVARFLMWRAAAASRGMIQMMSRCPVGGSTPRWKHNPLSPETWRAVKKIHASVTGLSRACNRNRGRRQVTRS